MNIARDSVVSFHYRLCDEHGTELETSASGEPVVYLHGHNGIIPGLERAMAGRAAGEHFEAVVAPVDGYGERREDATQRVQMKHVLSKGKLKPGMTIAVNTDHGPRQVQVIKAGKFVVDVDTNHPLAGTVLNFAIDIVQVRAATAEELAHGHAHGPGGHRH